MNDLEHAAAPESTPEQFLAEQQAKRRRRWRRMLAAAAVLAAALFFAFGGPWMVRRADESDTDCSNRDYQVAPGESEGCEWRARTWIFFAKLVPWVRGSAIDREKDIRWDQAERALKRATEITPDARRRDESAAALVDAAKVGPWTVVRSSDGETVTIDPRTSLTAILTSQGAHAVAARHHALATEPSAVKWAFEAALQSGKVSIAAEIARRTDLAPSWELDLASGAFLCLQGDEKVGLTRLERARTDYRAKISDDYAEAVIGRILCGRDGSVAFNGVVGRAAVHAASVQDADTRAGVPLDRLLAVDQSGSFDLRERLDVEGARTVFVVRWLLAAERPVDEVVDAVAAVALELAWPLSPYTLQGASSQGFLSSHPVALDPEAHERAAEKLLAYAEKPIALPDYEKLGKGGVRHERSIEAYARFGPAVAAARKDPKVALQRAAWTMWIEAASARAVLGDPGGAARDARRALAIDSTPDTRIFVAALLMAAGDDPGAKGQLAEVAQTPVARPATAALAEILQALAAAREGRWDDAHAAAKEAHRRADGPVSTASAWMLAATSIKLGRHDEGPGVATPEGYETQPTTWEKLAAMPESERKPLRLRMFGFDPPAGGSIVLPAVFYVVGQAAEGTDPEAWIDAAIPIHYGQCRSPVALRARAEAARWRGDEAAAKALDERAATLQKLADTPAKLVLAKLAGVY